MDDQKLSKEDCALFGAAAAAYWADRLRDGRPPSLVRDAGHPDDCRSLFGDFLVARQETPTMDAIGTFEQVLATMATERLARYGCLMLAVDYGPEGLLGEAARAARVGPFPFKTNLQVDEDGIYVKEGYGDEGRWLCQTKKCAVRRAVSALHWGDSPWSNEARTQAQIDAWEARGDRIRALFDAMSDFPAGDFDGLVAATWRTAAEPPAPVVATAPAPAAP